MISITIHPAHRLQGKPKIPGDKSISHRSLLFGALASGTTRISQILESDDVRSTWNCLEKLGVQIIREKESILVHGRGAARLQAPQNPLDCGNSGTTLRLLMGILASLPFQATLIGDQSLSRRPMKRVAGPLRQMGAQIQLERNEFAPVQILGRSRLQPIHYELPIASAQIKSALLLAGLSSEGETLLTGKIQSRDHTERLFGHFGVKLTQASDKISLNGGQTLRAADVTVPGDISSAAFWIIAALIIPRTILELENISLNPTRTGILSVLARMGAKIDTEVTSHTPEPVGRIRVQASPLLATQIQADEIASLIDELPLLAVLATFAEGTTRVKGAEELRSKETDRIEAIAINLRAMGIQVDTFPDGFSIQGPQPLRGARLQSWDDHRIAMAFSIAALQANGPTEISAPECVGVSYPTFYETLREIVKC